MKANRINHRTVNRAEKIVEYRRLEDYDGSLESELLKSTSVPTNTTIETILNPQDEDLESLSLEPMKYCARFESCSAPKCPLDILIAVRHYEPGEPKCDMAKNTMKKYYESMPDRIKKFLPYGDLLESKYNRSMAARERRDTMSDENKQKLSEAGKKALRMHGNRNK